TTMRPTSLITFSLHDALPISQGGRSILGDNPPSDHGGHAARVSGPCALAGRPRLCAPARAAAHVKGLRRFARCVDRPPACYGERDRKSTRLNSSHLGISYAVF